MRTSHTSVVAGVIFAIVATLGWALNFIAPYVTGAYSVYDLMSVRFLMAGGVGVAGVILCRAQLRALPARGSAGRMGLPGLWRMHRCGRDIRRPGIDAGFCWNGPGAAGADRQCRP